MELSAPTFQDVLLAQKRIRPYLARTPLHSYPAINELVGAEVYIKHENYQPVGAFKVRGGVNLIALLSDEERAPLAAAYRLRAELGEKKVGVVCSGGNVAIEHLKLALQD
jgi:threonine dehydratase